MKKFSKLNEGYQLLGLDSNQLVNELKIIGTNITIDLKFLKLNYDGSIYNSSEWIEYSKSDLSSPQSIKDEEEYLFLPHFYLSLKLIPIQYDSSLNFINSHSENIEFSGAFTIFPFLDQLTKLKDILQKYEDNYQVLLYNEHGDDIGGGSTLSIPESTLQIELLGRDPFDIQELLKFIK